MMKQFLANSYLFGGNAPFVEELYERTSQPAIGRPVSGASSSTSWQVLPGAAARDVAHAPIVDPSRSARSRGPARRAAVHRLSVERKQV